MLASLDHKIKQYLIVTGNYWAFTLTDGALRMLVVLHFHAIGYGALDIALLFVFYEFFGVVTNLVGGWLGARIGLNRTMQIGLCMQVFALLMLTVPDHMLTVIWVMIAQALSGIAKDLNKMSAKSSIKHLVPENAQGSLYRWIAILTGSKNTLKGVGFFMGALLLSWLSFAGAMWLMAIFLSVVALLSMYLLQANIGQASYKPKFKDILSKSDNINRLSAARMFLFGARDIWFVIALPVYLSAELGWQNWTVGAFLAAWVIVYGVVQGLAPHISQQDDNNSNLAFRWGVILSMVTLVLTIVMVIGNQLMQLDNDLLNIMIIVGLMLFGVCFAINSSLHSYLIVALAKSDGVSLDVGFYYMANAMGRLIGTLLSGWLYQRYGLEVCLAGAFLMLAAATYVVKFVKMPNIN